MSGRIFEGLVPTDGMPLFVEEQWHRLWPVLDTLGNGEVLVAREPDGNQPIDARAERLEALPAEWRAWLEAHGFVPLPKFPSRVLLSVALTGELVGVDVVAPHPRRAIA